jgi:hypothetical protein
MWLNRRDNPQTDLQLDILGVKKNPSGQLYTQLGVITKGTIIEVNVSELGLVTTSGKVVWGKQIYFGSVRLVNKTYCLTTPRSIQANMRK